MTARPDRFGWVARREYPRLALLLVGGTAVCLVGALLAITAGPLGHDLGTVGIRLAVLGAVVFAFAASGLVAFGVFDRGFD